MNQRIKELAHKAEFINKRHNGDEWRWGYIDPELSAKLANFAELLVQECASLVRDVPAVASGRLSCDQIIKEHFGLE